MGGPPGLPAETWADGLERREDGWWPRFDVDVLVRTVREADSRTYWDEWEGIGYPILVVRGAGGTVPRDHALEVVRRARAARLVEIALGPDGGLRHTTQRNYTAHGETDCESGRVLADQEASAAAAEVAREHPVL